MPGCGNPSAIGQQNKLILTAYLYTPNFGPIFSFALEIPYPTPDFPGQCWVLCRTDTAGDFSTYHQCGLHPGARGPACGDMWEEVTPACFSSQQKAPGSIPTHQRKFVTQRSQKHPGLLDRQHSIHTAWGPALLQHKCVLGQGTHLCPFVPDCRLSWD